jgi:hypothetical protein
VPSSTTLQLPAEIMNSVQRFDAADLSLRNSVITA